MFFKKHTRGRGRPLTISLNSKTLKWESLLLLTAAGREEKLVPTYNNRKISNYSTIVVMISTSTKDARNTFVLPTSVFTQSTERVYTMDTTAGQNGEYFHQNAFRYVNDYTVAIKCVIGSIQYMEIFGLRFG